jgi:hypothetical protein
VPRSSCRPTRFAPDLAAHPEIQIRSSRERALFAACQCVDPGLSATATVIAFRDVSSSFGHMCAVGYEEHGQTRVAT